MLNPLPLMSVFGKKREGTREPRPLFPCLRGEGAKTNTIDCFEHRCMVGCESNTQVWLLFQVKPFALKQRPPILWPALFPLELKPWFH